uniref:Uncharacterized protein n=1 Tax=Parascaris univalens TaxID=6257 RepID=A0A915BE34_PARUN
GCESGRSSEILRFAFEYVALAKSLGRLMWMRCPMLLLSILLIHSTFSYSFFIPRSSYEFDAGQSPLDTLNFLRATRDLFDGRILKYKKPRPLRFG